MNRRTLLIAAIVIIVLVVGAVVVFRLATGETQNGLSFAQIYSVMKPSCTEEERLNIYMYIAPNDTQIRNYTVKNERLGTSTTNASPVTEPNGSPKYYERTTPKPPAGTMNGDTLTVTLQVAHKISPSQSQSVSFICNTGQLVGDTTVKTTLVPVQ